MDEEELKRLHADAVRRKHLLDEVKHKRKLEQENAEEAARAKVARKFQRVSVSALRAEILVWLLRVRAYICEGEDLSLGVA